MKAPPFTPAVVILLLVSSVAPSPPPADLLVCGAPGTQANPAITGDGKGGAIIAWSDSRHGGYDVYAQHLLPSGRIDPAWPTQGLPVCEAENDQAAPSITTDGRGGAIVTWFDQRGGKDHDIYAQRILASGRVDPQWPKDGVALCTAPGHQQAPAIVSDGAGGGIVTWFDYRSGQDAHIYAQHVIGSGTIDLRWTREGVALCTAGGSQFFPRAIRDSAGGAIIAWYDHRGADYDVYAQRVLASGVVDPRWPQNGRALCTARNDQRNPSLISDGRGGAIVAWEDARDDARKDLYAQHVLGSGTVDAAWPDDGRAVAAGPGAQIQVVMAPDGAGGAILAWQDDPGMDANIVARRLRSSGALDSLRVVCDAPEPQDSPVIVADGDGGACVAWQDHRSGRDYDLYGARVTANGTLAAGEHVNGHVLCAAPGNQLKPVMETVASGAAVLAWEDSRAGTESDLRATRIRWRSTSGTRRSASPQSGR